MATKGTKYSGKRFIKPFSKNVGRRTGRDILAGKKVRVNEDGFEEFDDYLSESDLDMTRERVLMRRIVEERESQLSDGSGKENMPSQANKVSQSMPSQSKLYDASVSHSQLSQDGKLNNRSRFGWLRNKNIGRRTGKDIIAGKEIRRDEDGFEVFDDYLSPASGTESFLSGSSAHSQRCSQGKPVVINNRMANGDKSVAHSRNETTESDEEAESQSQSMGQTSSSQRRTLDSESGHVTRQQHETENIDSNENHDSTSESESEADANEKDFDKDLNTCSSSPETIQKNKISNVLAYKSVEVVDIVDNESDEHVDSKHTDFRLKHNTENPEDLDGDSSNESDDGDDDDDEEHHSVAVDIGPVNNRKQSMHTVERQASNSSAYTNDFENEFRNYIEETHGSIKSSVRSSKRQKDISYSSVRHSGTEHSETEKERTNTKKGSTRKNAMNMSHRLKPETETLESDINAEEDSVSNGEVTEIDNEEVTEMKGKRTSLISHEDHDVDENEESDSEHETDDEDVATSSQTGIDVAGNRSGSITKLDAPDTSKVNFDRTRKRLSYSALELSEEMKKERRSRVNEANRSLQARSSKTSGYGRSGTFRKGDTSNDIVEHLHRSAVNNTKLAFNKTDNRTKNLDKSEDISTTRSKTDISQARMVDRMTGKGGDKTEIDRTYYEPSEFVSLASVARRRSTFVYQRDNESDEDSIEILDDMDKKRKSIKGKEPTLDKKKVKEGKRTKTSTAKAKHKSCHMNEILDTKEAENRKDSIAESEKPRKGFIMTADSINNDNAAHKLSMSDHDSEIVIVDDIPKRKGGRKGSNKSKHDIYYENEDIDFENLNEISDKNGNNNSETVSKHQASTIPDSDKVETFETVNKRTKSKAKNHSKREAKQKTRENQKRTRKKSQSSTHLNTTENADTQKLKDNNNPDKNKQDIYDLEEDDSRNIDIHVDEINDKVDTNCAVKKTKHTTKLRAGGNLQEEIDDINDSNIGQIRKSQRKKQGDSKQNMSTNEIRKNAAGKQSLSKLERVPLKENISNQMILARSVSENETSINDLNEDDTDNVNLYVEDFNDVNNYDSNRKIKTSKGCGLQHSSKRSNSGLEKYNKVSNTVSKDKSQRQQAVKIKTTKRKILESDNENNCRKTRSRKRLQSQSLRKNSKLKSLGSKRNNCKKTNLAELVEVENDVTDSVSKPKKSRTMNSDSDSQYSAKRKLEFKRNMKQAKSSNRNHSTCKDKSNSDLDKNSSSSRRKTYPGGVCTTPAADSTLTVATNFNSGVSFRVARRSELLNKITSGYGNVPNMSTREIQQSEPLTPCISKGGKSRKSKGHRVSICPLESTVFSGGHSSADEISMKKKKRARLSSLGTTLPSMNSSLKHYGEQSQPGTPHPGEDHMDYLKSRLIIPEPAPPGLRRSKRNRLRPVADYKGEEIIYARKNAYDWVIVGVKESNEVRYNKMEAEKRKRRQLLYQIRKASQKDKSGILNRKLSIHVQLPEDAHPVDASEITVPDPWSEDSLMLDCIATMDSRSPVGPHHGKPTKDDPYLIKKLIDQPLMSSGELTIKPGCEKPPQLVDSYATLFMIHYGKLLVTIHNTTSILGIGDHFFVPYGCSYSIKNLRNDNAQLFYNVLKCEVNENANPVAQ